MEEIDHVLARLAVAADDQAAWQQFVLLTWPYVRTLGHRFVAGFRRVVDEDDLAQEVFLRFARYWRVRPLDPPARTGEELWTLLAIITRHTARDEARFLHADRRDISRTTGSPDGELPDRRYNPEADVELRDLLDRVRIGLSPEERRVLTLRLQSHTVPEIAQRLGCSSRTVERRLRTLADSFRLYLPEADKESETAPS